MPRTSSPAAILAIILISYFMAAAEAKPPQSSVCENAR
jgi:hypothetical protein